MTQEQVVPSDSEPASARCQWADRCVGEPVAILTFGVRGSRETQHLCAWHLWRLAIEPLDGEDSWWDWADAAPLDPQHPWAPPGADVPSDLYADFPSGFRRAQQAVPLGWHPEEPVWWNAPPPRPSVSDGAPDFPYWLLMTLVAVFVLLGVHWLLDRLGEFARTGGF